MTLLCLGPTPAELAAWQSDLPAPWQFMCLLHNARLRPWETIQVSDSGIACLQWSAGSEKIEQSLFLFELLSQLDWQAIWITAPQWAFLGTYVACLRQKPAFLNGALVQDAALFQRAESRWLLENAQIYSEEMRRDSDLPLAFPIAPHLGIVYTKFVSETASE